jgi:hypothetical protein
MENDVRLPLGFVTRMRDRRFVAKREKFMISRRNACNFPDFMANTELRIVK